MFWRLLGAYVECPLMAISGHTERCARESALPPKADVNGGPSLCSLMMGWTAPHAASRCHSGCRRTTRKGSRPELYHSSEEKQFAILGNWPDLVVYQPFQFIDRRSNVIKKWLYLIRIRLGSLAGIADAVGGGFRFH